MSLARHRTDIESELITQMEILHPGIIILGENSDGVSANNDSWIRTSITVLDITYPCLNNLQSRTEAIFNVQVFTPLAIGSGEASTMIDEARSILKSASLSKIEFLNFDVTAGTRESDWYVILLRAIYRADD